MIKQYEKLLSNKDTVGEVTNEQFFTDVNVNGYMSKEEMLKYANDLTKLQRAQLELLVEYTVDGFPVTSLPIPAEDKETGELVLWTTVKLPKTAQNFRLIYHPGILRFIKDCQQDKIKPSFTFDELIVTAINAKEQIN